MIHIQYERVENNKRDTLLQLERGKKTFLKVVTNMLRLLMPQTNMNVIITLSSQSLTAGHTLP